MVPSKGAHRPVHEGNTFIPNNGTTQVEFKTVKVDPPEFGIVAQDTVIHEGKPIQHKAGIVAPFSLADQGFIQIQFEALG